MNCLIGLLAGFIVSGYLTILFIISGSNQSDQSGGRNFAAALSIILALMLWSFDQRLDKLDQLPWQPYFSIAMMLGAFTWANVHSKNNPLK